MDTRNSTENIIVPALALAVILICWGALQAMCVVVEKIEMHKAPVAVVARS